MKLNYVIAPPQSPPSEKCASGIDEREFAANVSDALELDGRTFAMTDDFRWYEGWDSLAELSLVAMLDTEYGVEIEKTDLDRLVTIRDLFDEVTRRKLASASASTQRTIP